MNGERDITGDDAIARIQLALRVLYAIEEIARTHQAAVFVFENARLLVSVQTELQPTTPPGVTH